MHSKGLGAVIAAATMSGEDYLRFIGRSPNEIAAARWPVEPARAPAASLPTAAPAIATQRELSPEPRQLVAETAIEAGLRAAVRRQIEKARPGATVLSEAGMEQYGIEQELQGSSSDNAQLGLAKAVARQCVRQIGIERSVRTIQAVRDLTAT